MEHVTLHRNSRNGGVIKALLIILGGITLLVILALAGGGWYAKTKIDEAGGLQAFSGKMMTKGIEVMRPEIAKPLGPQDRQRLDEALATLQKAAPGLTPDQIKSLSETVQIISQKMQRGTLSENDAKTFVDDLTRLLSPPSDILDSESIEKTKPSSPTP